VPKEFEDCVKNGGKVRTIIVNKKKGLYMHICYKGGKSYPGEVLQKKSEASDILEELKILERYWHDRNSNKKES